MEHMIRITEQDIRDMVMESVRRTVNEDYYGEPDDRQDEDLSGELDIQLTQKDLSEFRKAFPGSGRLIARIPRGLSVRVFYSSYGNYGADIHRVRITDREAQGWQSDLLSVGERQKLEKAFEKYARQGGFDRYIFGEEDDDLNDGGYEQFGDGEIHGSYDDHETDYELPADRKDEFLGGRI